MKNGVLLALALSACASLTQSATVGQEPCGPTNIVLERMYSEYGEVPVAIGLMIDEQKVIIFASKETWTMFSLGDRQLCMVATGFSLHKSGRDT